MRPPPFTIHIGPNIRKSPYFDATVADGVRSFSVYNHMFIPGHFGDPDAEYNRLIKGVAQWDVGAQRQVELFGPDAGRLAQYLTTRDLSKTSIGQGRYAPICNHQGILINDPVLLKVAEDRFWLSIADSDIALWAEAIALERTMDVRVHEPDVSPLAIQGPKAIDVVRALFGDWVSELHYFGFGETNLDGIPLIVSKSGWSKQGGFELYLMDGSKGTELWERVKDAGQPFGIGPGAPNDSERLESGLVSYGADGRYQTHPVNPFEIGLGKLIDLDGPDDFIGRDALMAIRADGIKRRRAGLIIDGKPITTWQHPVDILHGGSSVGFVSEATYSSRLGCNIGVGIVSTELAQDASDLCVCADGQERTARLTTLPFIS